MGSYKKADSKALAALGMGESIYHLLKRKQKEPRTAAQDTQNDMRPILLGLLERGTVKGRGADLKHVERGGSGQQ